MERARTKQRNIYNSTFDKVINESDGNNIQTIPYRFQKGQLLASPGSIINITELKPKDNNLLKSGLFTEELKVGINSLNANENLSESRKVNECSKFPINSFSFPDDDISSPSSMSYPNCNSSLWFSNTTGSTLQSADLLRNGNLISCSDSNYNTNLYKKNDKKNDQSYSKKNIIDIKSSKPRESTSMSSENINFSVSKLVKRRSNNLKEYIDPVILSSELCVNSTFLQIPVPVGSASKVDLSEQKTSNEEINSKELSNNEEKIEPSAKESISKLDKTEEPSAKESISKLDKTEEPSAKESISKSQGNEQTIKKILESSKEIGDDSTLIISKIKLDQNKLRNSDSQSSILKDDQLLKTDVSKNSVSTNPRHSKTTSKNTLQELSRQNSIISSSTKNLFNKKLEQQKLSNVSPSKTKNTNDSKNQSIFRNKELDIKPSISSLERIYDNQSTRIPSINPADKYKKLDQSKNTIIEDPREAYKRKILEQKKLEQSKNTIIEDSREAYKRKILEQNQKLAKLDPPIKEVTNKNSFSKDDIRSSNQKISNNDNSIVDIYQKKDILDIVDKIDENSSGQIEKCTTINSPYSNNKDSCSSISPHTKNSSEDNSTSSNDFTLTKTSNLNSSSDSICQKSPIRKVSPKYINIDTPKSKRSKRRTKNNTGRSNRNLNKKFDNIKLPSNQKEIDSKNELISNNKTAAEENDEGFDLTFGMYDMFLGFYDIVSSVQTSLLCNENSKEPKNTETTKEEKDIQRNSLSNEIKKLQNNSPEGLENIKPN